MKKVVIGAGYGDEGKGLMVDYLCENMTNTLNVRFNGGPQAAHTVQRKGNRHVFHSYGSGSLVGASTYIDSEVLVMPSLIEEEGNILGYPKLYINKNCRLITPYDILWNLYSAGLTAEYTSCGMGIFSTIVRNKNIPLKISDKNIDFNIVKQYYIDKLNLEPTSNYKEYYLDLYSNCYEIIDEYQYHLNTIKSELVTELPEYENIVFEGAQGLLLDERYGTMPYCTPSNTGIENIKKYIDIETELIYVSRCYQTRHGAGPMESEIFPEFLGPRVFDKTNIQNQYQGALRYGKLDVDKLLNIIKKDSNGRKTSLAITCFDQVDEIKTTNGIYNKQEFIDLLNPRYVSYGSEAKYVKVY